MQQEFLEVRSKSPQNIATKFVAQGSLYGQCRRIENLIDEQNYFLKSDFDHVDFAVPARNINLTCWTPALEVCWSVRLPTCTTVVTKALAAFFPFSLTCYSILEFHYELKITASEDIPIFLAASNF